MPKQSIKDTSLLTAALEGLELQRARVDAQIREVKSMLGGKGARAAAEPAAAAKKPRKKRKKLSAAARARIAAAQKKRWAEYHKKAGAA